MKYEELTIPERANIRKYIKEELCPPQHMKNVIEIANPNQFNYTYKGGALQIQGKLVNMTDRQIKACAIRNVKEKLKQVVGK